MLIRIFQLVVKIATLSPADICYEESLSTLRYAERYTKAIIDIYHHEQ